ncbi:MAG: response regulator transcription factor [Lentisphaerota bacterium]
MTLERKKILLVDDHPIVLDGLTSFINQQPDLVVCGAERTFQQALIAAKDHKPDLIIADLTLQDSDGMDLLVFLKNQHPDIPVLVYSMHDELVLAESTFHVGARGYVMKNQGAEVLLAAIYKVLEGKTHVSQALREHLFHKMVDGPQDESPFQAQSLTDRELQIFRLLGQGKTTREIAGLLTISIKTVEVHREHIKAKLNLKNSAQLVHYASQQFRSTALPAS